MEVSATTAVPPAKDILQVMLGQDVRVAERTLTVPLDTAKCAGKLADFWAFEWFKPCGGEASSDGITDGF
ncbi:hypothetical protein WP50_14410 [Lactiplantibacillus plantarum]|nr:hypothetical protein WP50_14410 [Lactiplantibacillus plantarum]